MQSNQVSPFPRIQTFGSLQIYNAESPLLLKGEKIRSLLAYLILYPRIPHRRERLADILWPDSPPERVRRNLSDLVYRLQKTIAPDWLKVDGNTIAFQPNVDLWVDLWEFDNLVASKDSDQLRRAVELYAGDLLHELYDEWIIAERELRRSQYLSVVETLCAHHEARGELQQALLYARRLVLTEPLHEPAHQSYLRLLGRLKRFGEASAHYEYLRKLMQRELNSEPMAETRAIFRSLERERDLEHMPVVVEETRPFIGRTAERAAALAAVETMLSGKGDLLAVEGEAGIGKSRLLREVMAGARWRGATVLQGQASETPGASPFSPLVGALTPLINSPRGEQLETLLSGERLAALAPLHPAWSRKAVLYEVPPEQASNRFHAALRSFGEALAQLAPIVLALDDLHWADPVLWDCLRALAPGFAGHGGLLVLAYRRPEIEDLPGWRVIQEWERDRLLKIVSLEPLHVEEVAEFVGETTGVDPAELRAWTGGNPFFINEWLAEPELRQPAKHNAILLRLQRLSPAAKVALEAASILGENIPYQLWIDISELAPLALADLGDELVRQHWLQPSRAGYTFNHDLIRTAIYEGMEAGRRRVLHERAARAYSALDPDNLRARAFHLDHAGLAAEAARAYRLVGGQEHARFAFREAQRALERALALMAPVPTLERVEVALELAEVCDRTGDRGRQKAALYEALAGVRKKGREADLLRTRLVWGRFATRTGQPVKAERQLKAALKLAQKLGDHDQETQAFVLLSALAIEQSKWTEGRTWAESALKQTRAAGNRYYEGLALCNIGMVVTMSQPAEAIQWFEQAIAVQAAIGDRSSVSITQTNLLIAFYELGAWDRLIATAEQLVPLKDALGDRVGAASARHNQALAYYALGDYSTARLLLGQVIRDSEAIQSGRRIGLARNVLGLVAEAEGNYEEALDLYRTALADVVAAHSALETAYVQHDLGALLVRLEQPSEAIRFLEAARIAWTERGNLLLQLKSDAHLGLASLAAGDRVRAQELAANGWTSFRAGVPVGEQPQDWLWSLYRLLMALEQSDQACAVLRAAYAELQRQSQSITDPNLRRSFFERVRLNREIVVAYDQLTGTPRTLSVALARRDVPLGRSLRADEFITVQWTLSAPEDEALPDKSRRRRHRLKRLLEEAEKQGAAPTDDNLAQALGVSRRTILRDMQELTQEYPRPPTRKRKG